MTDPLTIVQDKIRCYRKIEYLLKKYSQITPDPRCLEFIVNGDANSVSDWFKRKLLSDLDSLTLSDLREKAAILRVTPVWGLNKQTLILRILEKLDESRNGEKETE